MKKEQIAAKSGDDCSAPLGTFPVVMRSVFVGNRAGPQMCKLRSFAPTIRSEHTFSTAEISHEVRAIRMRCNFCSSLSKPLTSLSIAFFGKKGKEGEGRVKTINSVLPSFSHLSRVFHLTHKKK